MLAYGLDRQAAEWSSPRATTDGGLHHTPGYESARHGPAFESWTGFVAGAAAAREPLGHGPQRPEAWPRLCARRPQTRTAARVPAATAALAVRAGRQAEAAAGDGDAIAVDGGTPP